MFGSKEIFVVSAILLVYCESYSVGVKKCGIEEDECQKEIYRKIIQDSAETGIKEMDIPPFDPFVIDNIEVQVMGLIKIGVSDGTAKGLKSCDTTVLHQDMEKKVTTLELVCEVLTVEANCKIETTPFLDGLIGGIKIHGDGKGGVKIENVKINFEIPFDIKKLDDGELHAVINTAGITYTFEVLGKMSINLENLYIGSQEISAVAVNVINENWQFFAKSVGKNVLDTVLELIYKWVYNFFKGVPVKDLVETDMSVYATN